MKAVILVGGYGTRLRPLTLSVPKPLVEFCNKPIVLYQIEALAKVGVTHIIFAVSYRAEMLEKLIIEMASDLTVKITFSVENEPLGTAGPLALAEKLLLEDDEPFFVLNSDVIAAYPFQKLLEFHKNNNCEGSIVVTKVDEPSKYGVVVFNKNFEITKFVEKPIEFISNKINAGIYIFNKTILSRINLQPTSIEKDVFPKVAQDGQLYAFVYSGFWCDIGQPKDFLKGTSLYLNHLKSANSNLVAKHSNCTGNVLLDPSSIIESNCIIGPNVVIGPNCVIKSGSRIKNSVILANVKIGLHSYVDSSIIGWNSKLGKWVRIENVSVLGEDVTVIDEMYVNGGRILPHKEIKESVPKPNIIM